MQRRKGMSLLGFLVISCLGQTQTVVWNAATVPTDPTFTSHYTSIHGFPTLAGMQAIDVTLNQLWAQVGQTFPLAKNWSAHDGFSLTVENKETFPVSLGFKVDRSSGAPMTSIFEIPANKSVRFFVDNSGFTPAQTGMDRPLPIFQGFYRHSMVFAPQELGSVTKWSLYYRQSQPARVLISSISGHAVNLSYPNSVDRFGQLSYQTWTGKATSDSDLALERDREAVEVSANPGGGETWGSATLHTVIGTGKWRTIRSSNGKQYIVTPSGRLFWSVGTTSVTSNNPTIVSGREHMFEDLPEAGDPEANFYSTFGGQATFDFTTANLARKYGVGWQTSWRTRAIQRMKSWGFNTLGSGSDLGLLDEGNMCGILNMTTKEFPVRLEIPWHFWGNLPDPHHSAFSSWIANKYRASLQWHCRNGRLMGVFVDGENAWIGPDGLHGKYQIPLAALASPKTQPSKQVFLAQLRGKYGTIQMLNTAWRTNYPSWTHMYDNQITLAGGFSDQQVADLSKFFDTFVAKYYHGVKSALTNIGVNCLFMGSKDAQNWTPPEVHVQAAKYVDLISMTYYGKVQNIPWDYLNSLKKPVIIAEFSFSSNDRGPSASTNWMGDLQFESDQRALEARAYLDRALATPNIVGAHWYSYRDNVLSGRAADTQNYSVGLVDVTDRPYDEMVGVYRSFTGTMYSTRGW